MKHVGAWGVSTYVYSSMSMGTSHGLTKCACKGKSGSSVFDHPRNRKERPEQAGVMERWKRKWKLLYYNRIYIYIHIGDRDNGRENESS